MNLTRRSFFKILSAGLLTSSMKPAFARDPAKIPENAVGILYDATICIGCKTCEVGCKIRNSKLADHHLEKAFGVKKVWDSSTGLSVNTLNKIKLYKSEDTFSFVKRSCMHCADPNCVSACPVSALTKDPYTGIVSYNKDACIGCRYCQVACPLNVPRFQFDEAFPEITKCEMCKDVIAEGGIPGCCEYCPCGASVSGKVSDLLKEAHRRIKLQEGTTYKYPVSSLSSKKRIPKKVSKYISYVYGEIENGGTQCMILSSVPFNKLGLPNLDSQSKAVISENIQHTLYQGMIAPIALFAGLAVAAHRSVKREDKWEEKDHV